MAKHRDIKLFSAELVPWSLRLMSIPLDASHDEVEGFLQKVGFASCIFYWDHAAIEVLGTKNPGWCIVVFPLDGLAVLAASALSGRVFNGRTVLATQAPCPQWYHQQRQQQQQQQQTRGVTSSYTSATLHRGAQQQEQPTKSLGQRQPASDAMSWDLRKHRFPPAAAARSINLADIDWQTPRIGVLALLAREGLSNCKLYWADEKPKNPAICQYHPGSCWVELPNAAVAAQAWKALDGLYFQGRFLKVTSLDMPFAYAFGRPLTPTRDPQRAQSDREGPAAAPQPPTTSPSSLPLASKKNESMAAIPPPAVVQHALKPPVPSAPTTQSTPAKTAFLVPSTSSPLPRLEETTTPLAVTADVAPKASQSLPEETPNAYEVARETLRKPHRKLQESQEDEAESKSRFILEKVMENLELFRSGQGAKPTSVDGRLRRFGNVCLERSVVQDQRET